MNKKAVSEIVATVLIILLTVASIGILIGVVVPMVKKGLDSGSTCFDATSSISVITEKGYTCINRTGKTVKVHIGRGSKDFELADLRISVYAAGNSKTINGTKLPNAGETKVIIIDVDDEFASANEVGVAPIVRIGETTQSCDEAQRVPLKECR